MTDYAQETPASLFPGYGNATQEILFSWSLKIEYLSNASGTLVVLLSLISVVIQVFHIGILSSKEMRKSVVNLIMIAISTSYIIYLLVLADLRHKQTTDEDACAPPAPYWSLQVQILFYAFQLFAAHSATWLGILMASLRLIILKFPFNYKLQKVARPKNGLKLIMGTLIVCFPLSFLYYFRFKVVEYDAWVPDESCTTLPSNYSAPSYGIEQSDLFSFDNLIVYRFYLAAEGVFGKLIPGLLYPILTFMLISQIRVGNENRARLGTSYGTENKTTLLVSTMTALHLICDLPKGIVALAQSYLVTADGFLVLAANIMVLLNTLLIVNTIIQCVIFYALSSNYRKSLAQFLKVEFQWKRNEISVV